MSYGTFDRLVQVRRNILVDDGFRQVETWSDLGAPIWAGRRDVSDGEKAVAGSFYAEVAARFTVRSCAFTRAVTPKDVLVHEGREWEILGIKELDRGRHLEITATARADLT